MGLAMKDNLIEKRIFPEIFKNGSIQKRRFKYDSVVRLSIYCHIWSRAHVQAFYFKKYKEEAGKRRLVSLSLAEMTMLRRSVRKSAVLVFSAIITLAFISRKETRFAHQSSSPSERRIMLALARSSLLLAAAFLSCCYDFCFASSATSPPNVLVLLIDDMGYSDLGAFGSPNASTPHIDGLISSGVKMTQWISAAPICTPSRAAFQTGRYPIRTGCMGNVERYRVVPTPSNPHGLDPKTQVSIAAALKKAGYDTGMSGKWHLGINRDNAKDGYYAPNSHGYDTYLGSPYTNAPMCEMNAEGVSLHYPSGPIFCFATSNRTVVQQPLRLENFTRMITNHAVDFIQSRSAAKPWFFFMSYFHVHTPLFTMRHNRGRSKGGEFGDNVEELDDSVGEILGALDSSGFRDNTIIFITSDNGPYQEEGWDKSGRTNIYGSDGALRGRLRGGKGQSFEGGGE